MSLIIEGSYYLELELPNFNQELLHCQSNFLHMWIQISLEKKNIYLSIFLKLG